MWLELSWTVASWLSLWSTTIELREERVGGASEEAGLAAMCLDWRGRPCLAGAELEGEFGRQLFRSERVSSWRPAR